MAIRKGSLTMKGAYMAIVNDIYELIRGLLSDAEKAKNDTLYSKLIDIKKQVNDLDEENQLLKKQLDIRNTMEYSEDAKYFTLPSKPNIRYCSTCYGYDGKLIPMTNGDRGYLCRVCEEIWMEKGTKR